MLISSSSGDGASPSSGRSAMRSSLLKTSLKPSASTTLTMFSSERYCMSGQPAACASWKRRRTSRGSAMPEHSTTRWSYALPRMKESETSSASAPSRSSPDEQHTHPFESSTKSSGSPTMVSSPFRCVTSLASMLTAPMSLTTAPIFRPSELVRRCCSSVVFPVPRKPERMVTEIGCCCITAFSSPPAAASPALGAMQAAGPCRRAYRG